MIKTRNFNTARLHVAKFFVLNSCDDRLVQSLLMRIESPNELVQHFAGPYTNAASIFDRHTHEIDSYIDKDGKLSSAMTIPCSAFVDGDPDLTAEAIALQALAKKKELLLGSIDILVLPGSIGNAGSRKLFKVAAVARKAKAYMFCPYTAESCDAPPLRSEYDIEKIGQTLADLKETSRQDFNLLLNS